MLQLGIVGLGGISQKAYLPYMRQVTGVHWHLFTRQKQILEEVNMLFGSSTAYDSLDSLAEHPLDGVFIHVATSAHFDIAKLFLKKGIPVFMDKPLTEDYTSTKALYDLAKDHKTFLMAGFNRRFAPRIMEMKKVEDKNHIRTFKNAVNAPADFQYKLFDMFIHPLDTALFLTNNVVKRGYFVTKRDGNKILQVSVTLETDSEIIEASMNLQSGSRREIIEIESPEVTYSLDDLSNLSVIDGFDRRAIGFGSWASTLEKRGFEPMIDAFIQVITTGVNPISPKSSLLSHFICDQINKANAPFGMLNLKIME